MLTAPVFLGARWFRGCGAAGSAPAWHAGGQGFESPQLHLNFRGRAGLAVRLGLQGRRAPGGEEGAGQHQRKPDQDPRRQWLTQD